MILNNLNNYLKIILFLILIFLQQIIKFIFNLKLNQQLNLIIQVFLLIIQIFIIFHY